MVQKSIKNEKILKFIKAPMNFLMFVLHGSAKIFFLTLYGT